MTDRPIIFSAPMVRALLAGRLSQTRLVLKDQPSPNEPIGGASPYGQDWVWQHGMDGSIFRQMLPAPPYAPGDRLWVREAWRIGAWHGGNATVAVDYCNGPRKEWLDVEDGYMLHRLIDQSRADAVKAGMPLRDSCYEYSWSPGRSPCRWRSPIHMPRRASRLTLLVTDVRVQRLQEITAEDVTAEGIPFEADALAPYEWSVARFADLWNTIHGPDAWDANPWCAAISFTVHRCNIDKMEEGTW